jgi:hypothetical protein
LLPSSQPARGPDPAADRGFVHLNKEELGFHRRRRSRFARWRGRGARRPVLILLLAALRVADEPPFSSGFPHLYYDDNGWLDGDLAVIARFDAMSAAFWNQEGTRAARLDSLHFLAPDLLRLAYLNPAGRSLPGIDDPGCGEPAGRTDPGRLVRPR